MVEHDYQYWPKEKPLLIVHGDADAVTSCKASKELVEKTEANDKEHKAFEGQFHEVWHEKGNVKIEFVKYIIQ